MKAYCYDCITKFTYCCCFCQRNKESLKVVESSNFFPSDYSLLDYDSVFCSVWLPCAKLQVDNPKDSCLTFVTLKVSNPIHVQYIIQKFFIHITMIFCVQHMTDTSSCGIQKLGNVCHVSQVARFLTVQSFIRTRTNNICLLPEHQTRKSSV